MALQSTQWHANHVIEPVVAVKRGALPQSAAPAPAPTEELAKALYDYETSAYDELPFKKGDWLIITERTSKDWFRGRIQGKGDGKERLFPANYVEVIPIALNSGSSSAPSYAGPSGAQPYQAPGAVPPGGADGDKWNKVKDSRAGQAAIGGLAFGE